MQIERVLISVATLVTLCQVSPALGGTEPNGTEPNGTEPNGTEPNGTEPNGTEPNGTDGRRMYLRGIHLAGVLPRDGELVSVELDVFTGDTASGRYWASAQGQWVAITLHASELVGLEWAETTCAASGDCDDRVYRIAAASEDGSRNTMPEHGDNSDIWLYTIEYADPASTGGWINACQPDQYGEDRGMFANGQWFLDGRYESGGFTFSCARGVIAKCARAWGYKPWRQLVSASGETVDMQPLHLACTRAARADYCGDGEAHTVDGTLVDIFDPYGFNVRENQPGFRPESGFGEDGALWVARKRWETGEGDYDGDETVFAGCRLPRAPARSASRRGGAALIYAWSRPHRLP